MENKKNIRIFSIVAVLLIVFIGLFLSFYLYGYLTENLILETVKKEPIAIDTELYQKLKDIPSYGVPVTAEEPGYGRENPFIPYKSLPSEAAKEEQDGAAVDEAIVEAQSS